MAYSHSSFVLTCCIENIIVFSYTNETHKDSKQNFPILHFYYSCKYYLNSETSYIFSNQICSKSFVMTLTSTLNYPSGICWPIPLKRISTAANYDEDDLTVHYYHIECQPSWPVFCYHRDLFSWSPQKGKILTPKCCLFLKRKYLCDCKENTYTKISLTKIKTKDVIRKKKKKHILCYSLCLNLVSFMCFF